MGEKLVGNLMMGLALVCGVGSLVLFLGFPLGSLGLVRWQSSETGIQWWDGLLSLAFFLQHSGMVRRQFRTRVYGRIPPPYHRALYSVASGITLAGVALLWQPSKSHLLTLDGPFRWAALVLAIGALALLIWGAAVLRTWTCSASAPSKRTYEATRRNHRRSWSAGPIVGCGTLGILPQSCCSGRTRTSPRTDCSSTCCGQDGSALEPDWRKATSFAILAMLT